MRLIRGWRSIQKDEDAVDVENVALIRAPTLSTEPRDFPRGWRQQDRG
ncbi:hypothetical protein MKK70_05825 [Methylobacterium sp. E-041]|nr:hypothetical protein [Methylobacterium sp. E-041]MCJ2104905.1 hypothetical protein [Methylobacterium sp. E-041]